MTVNTRKGSVTLRTKVFRVRCLTRRRQPWGSGGSSARSVVRVCTSCSSHPTGANGLTGLIIRNECRDLPLYYFKIIQGVTLPRRQLLKTTLPQNPACPCREGTETLPSLVAEHAFQNWLSSVRGQPRSVSRGERPAPTGASPPKY